jgi:hypothetical protein
MLRKRFIENEARPDDRNWLDLERLARVEITSEDAAYPIESALGGGGPGWRARRAGEQVIRVLFDESRSLKRIYLRFDEQHQARTQEFVVRWSQDHGHTYKEVVRQQYTFSPPGTTSQAEDYTVELDQVTALEIRIVPDISHGSACASLHTLGLA